MCTLKKIVGPNKLIGLFLKIISHYKKVGYYIYLLKQTAPLVVNSIAVVNIAFLFNFMPAGRTSDSMRLTKLRLYALSINPDVVSVVWFTGI